MQSSIRRTLTSVALALGTGAGVAHALTPWSPAIAAKRGGPGVAIASVTQEGPVPGVLRARLPLTPGSTRTVDVLVLLVDFPGLPGQQLPSHFDSLMFGVTDRSLRDYYRENSFGALDVQGAVATGWLRASDSLPYYAAGIGGLGSPPRNAQGLVEEAVRLADPYVNYAAFDNDGPDGIPRSQGSADDDGYVDYMVVVHAGPGRETTGYANDIHSHSWVTSQDVVTADQGVRAQAYSMMPETGNMGVFCHEFGHLLGLPDLYTQTNAGLGLFSLMATGVWAGDAQPGDHPTHLDAWCKTQLGFITPQVPTSNGPSVSLPPAETSPAAWKLWTNGRPGAEYFLAENRQRIGYDDTTPSSYSNGLPGVGMILYHVDDAIPGNLLPSGFTYPHLQVMVVEATGDSLGRGPLSQGFSPFWGSASTPFPGSGSVSAWTPTSRPSSRSWDNVTTQLGLVNITNSGGNILAALQVEDRPALEWDHADLGVGPIGAGSTAPFTPVIANIGLSADNVSTDVRSLDPNADITGSTTFTYGTVPADATAAPSTGSAQLALGAFLPADPEPVPLELAVTADGYASLDTLRVAVGATYAFGDDMESSTSRLVAQNATWHRAGERNATPAGSFAWKCGSTAALGEYASNLDVSLTTPSLLLDGTGVLTFSSWMDAEIASRTDAYDGGMVDISVGGRAWTPLVPDGDYPYRLRVSSGLPTGVVGRGVLGGHETGFTTYRIPLTGIVGEARIRFRFVSDGSNPSTGATYAGWFLDDVIVDTDTQPYVVVPADPVLDAQGMHLAWRLLTGRAGYDGAGFRVYRGVGTSGVDAGPLQRSLEGLTPLTSAPQPVSLLSATDPTPPTDGVPVFYLLADSAAGRPTRLIAFSGAQSSVTIRAVPTPVVIGSRAVTVIYQVPPSVSGTTHVSVRILDALGRVMATLVDEPQRSGAASRTWNGRTTSGAEAPPGVYHVLVDAAGEKQTARLVLLR